MGSPCKAGAFDGHGEGKVSGELAQKVLPPGQKQNLAREGNAKAAKQVKAEVKAEDLKEVVKAEDLKAEVKAEDLKEEVKTEDLKAEVEAEDLKAEVKAEDVKEEALIWDEADFEEAANAFHQDRWAAEAANEEAATAEAEEAADEV